MLALVLSFVLPAHALNPSWSFRTLESPHFEVIYHDSQKELAKRYLIAAEQAHEILLPVFKEAPDKTIIFLRDDTDSSNGLANFLPYPHITVYPVLPSTLDSIDEYGDWALEMILHEYTHILNMYPAHGIYVPFKYIFGTVVRPNAVLPRWWLEGLAVNTESAFSTHGRLKSSETGGSARALALDQKFKNENVARINESGLKTWPYGSRPYLYGAWWWDQAQREKGVPLIETLNQNYSRRLPFFLNGPFREQTAKTPDEFLKHTLEVIETQAQRQIAAIREAGVAESTAIAEPKGEQTQFAISPDGNRLVYWLSIAGLGSEARLKTRTQAGQAFNEIPSKKLFKSVGSLRVRWLNDRRFVYDQLDITDPYTTYRDVYVYDTDQGHSERLTEGARAQEPAPSPAGDHIAFIQNDGGRNRLAWLSLADKKIMPLVNGNFSQRLSWPEFINEHEIVFSVRQKSGAEKLHVVDVRSKKVSVFNDQLNAAQNPRWTSAGLLVTDARTKARNVYSIKSGRIVARTNTLTDIQLADYDPQRKELLVSELTGDGRRLKAQAFREHQPPTLESPHWEPPPQPSVNKIRIEEGSYQPLAYLLPRYWIPFIYQVEDGFIFQGLTANQDPAERNQYTLLASYDTVTKEPSYGVSYVNSSLPTDIGLSYAKSVSYLGASGLVVESQDAGLNFTQKWPFNSRFAQWSFGGNYSSTERGTIQYKRLGPEIRAQYSRLNNPLNERWGYHTEISHQEYVEQSDYLHYGRTYAHLALQASTFGEQRVFFQVRGAVAPEQPFGTIIDLGDRNVGGNYLINLANSQFLLRGYPSGTFVGRKVANANLEYALPLTDLDRGFGTFPMYLRGLEFALFGDVMAVDGRGYDQERAAYTHTTLGENYASAGGELRLNTTSFYHLPLSLTLGLYYGFNEKFGGGFSPFVGFGFGGLNPLQKSE